MEKKCKVCKVPLEGFLHKHVAKRFFGVERSEDDEELCNKCEAKKQGKD